MIHTNVTSGTRLTPPDALERYFWNKEHVNVTFYIFLVKYNRTL